MIKSKNILIKNLYYMLCYAFKTLESITKDSVELEDFENIQDLMSVILYKGISNQLKRGLYKEYEEQAEELKCVRGKINITQSVKNNSLMKRKIFCEFDEFTENSYFNQVLKSTCLLLLKKGNVREFNKQNLKKILLFFQNVEEVNLKNISWNSITYHRNNATYKMLINICYLIVKGMLMTDEKGNVTINKFIDPQLMHRLYEKFVLEYYIYHYNYLKPEASQIKWDVAEDENIDFLPSMKSDITLQLNDKILIIDTKFYNHSYAIHYDKASYISGNLYQIYTYVKNKDINKTGNVQGLLLYAKTKDEFITPEKDYNLGGNIIGVKVLDLNQDWILIKGKLNSIVDNIFV